MSFYKIKIFWEPYKSHDIPGNDLNKVPVSTFGPFQEKLT